MSHSQFFPSSSSCAAAAAAASNVDEDQPGAKKKKAPQDAGTRQFELTKAKIAANINSTVKNAKDSSAKIVKLQKKFNAVSNLFQGAAASTSLKLQVVKQVKKEVLKELEIVEAKQAFNEKLKETPHYKIISELFTPQLEATLQALVKLCKSIEPGANGSLSGESAKKLSEAMESLAFESLKLDADSDKIKQALNDIKELMKLVLQSPEFKNPQDEYKLLRDNCVKVAVSFGLALKKYETELDQLRAGVHLRQP